MALSPDGLVITSGASISGRAGEKKSESELKNAQKALCTVALPRKPRRKKSVGEGIGAWGNKLVNSKTAMHLNPRPFNLLVLSCLGPCFEKVGLLFHNSQNQAAFVGFKALQIAL
jgi:hypothetical protein